MGSRRRNLCSRITVGVTVLAFGAVGLVGCTSDPAPERATVTPEGAYLAIVQWELERTEPVVDEAGNIEPPVIYLASALGGTVDVGVQAEVVSAIADTAVIRFADDPRDARDAGLDGEPVKDDGVMFVLDEFEPDQAVLDALVLRYKSETDSAGWRLQVTPTDDGAEVTSAVAAELTSD